MAFRIPISYEHPTRSPHNTLDDELIGDGFFNTHDETLDILDANTRLFEYTHSSSLPKQDELDDWDFLEEDETMDDAEREQYEKDLVEATSAMKDTIKYQQEREKEEKEPEENEIIEIEDVKEIKKPRKEFICPRDDETIEKITKILRNEFEFEILNKEREISLIDERLAEAEELMKKLTESCWGPTRRKRKTDSHPEKEIEIEEERKIKKKKTKVVIEPNAKALFVRTQDGAFLQLSCPQCKRWRFVNKLGFVNHCRIVHQLKFPSFEDAAQHCGKIVVFDVKRLHKFSQDESEVPLDDPIRLEKPINMILDANNRVYVPPRPLLESNNTPSTLEPTHAPLDPDSISRFYIKKRIIVGNTSKHIIRKEGDMASHKWVLYIRGPEEDPDVTHFVKKVRFYLDDSFAPNNIVDVVEPPFQLSRRGWGEFTARVQVYFHGPKNKAVTVFHKLKLDKSRSGLRTLGAETAVDVELDRKHYEQQNPDRISQNKEPTPASPPPPPSSELTPTPAKNTDSNLNQVPVPQKLPEIAKTPETPRLITPLPSPIKKGPIVTPAPSNRVPELSVSTEKHLKDGVSFFPLIVTDPSKKPSTPVGYSIATTEKEWKDWSLAKRKAIEWRRAKKVQQYLKHHQKIIVSSKSIVLWCRIHGYTPSDYLIAPSPAIVIPPPVKTPAPPYRPAPIPASYRPPVIPPKPVIPPNLANRLASNPIPGVPSNSMPIVPSNSMPSNLVPVAPKTYTPPPPAKAFVYSHPPPTKNINYQNLPRPSHMGGVIAPSARAPVQALYSTNHSPITPSTKSPINPPMNPPPMNPVMVQNGNGTSIHHPPSSPIVPQKPQPPPVTNVNTPPVTEGNKT